MSKFKMFEVYLGTQNRKEDFFTYFLASCLSYIYKIDKHMFSNIIKSLFLPDIEGEIHLCNQNDLYSSLNPYYFNNKLADSYRESGDQLGVPPIFRELPLPKKDETNDYYLDLAIFVRHSPRPILLAIEGKVFDSSVKERQLERYYESIQSIKTNMDVKVFLLSTYDYTDEGTSSRARKEVNRFNKNHQDNQAKLLTWEDIDTQFAKHGVFDDKDLYFSYAWKDAYQQIKENAEQDKYKSATDCDETVGNLQELLENLIQFEKDGLKYVGFEGGLNGIQNADLPYLIKNRRYKLKKVQPEKNKGNWISIGTFIQILMTKGWFDQNTSY